MDNMLHLLMVEDDLAHAEIIRRNLEACPQKKNITHLSDGQAAMDYLKHRGNWSATPRTDLPDLILLDLRLPRLDGLDVLRQIKEDAHLSVIPVIIMSTSTAARDIQQAYRNRANSYLVKPLDFSQFAEQMKAFCSYWFENNCFPSGTANPAIR